MKLEEAISHMENFPPPEQTFEAAEHYQRILGWLKELKWFHDGKPVPVGLQMIIDALLDLHTNLVELSKPKYYDGCWNLDADAGECVNIAYCPKQMPKPYGVSKTTTDEDAPFGSGPDNVFATPEEALAAAKKILDL